MNILILFVEFLFIRIITSDVNEIKLESHFIIDTSDNNLYLNNDPRWGVSDYLRNYTYRTNFEFDSTKGVQFFDKLENVKQDENVTINLQDESFGVKIEYVNIIKDKITKLISGKQFLINKNISQKIIPQNYYNNSDFMSSDSLNNTEIIADCIIIIQVLVILQESLKT